MIVRLDGGRWYIDVRGAGCSEQHSLDLSQHLPRRLIVGRAAVITNMPGITLSVIRKRWMRLVRELETRRASTLNRSRRETLQREINNIQGCGLSAKPPCTSPPHTQVFFIKPEHVGDDLPEYMTLYIMVPLLSQTVLAAIKNLTPGGLIVIYTEWTAEYEALLQRAFR